MKKAFLASAALCALLFPLGIGSTGIAHAQESICDDGKDNDGDMVYDCGDSDCYKNDPICKADGRAENTNERCGDWIDNDGDGHLDCDDTDCTGPGITICEGSWDRSQTGGSSSSSDSNMSTADDDIPELAAGMNVEDLIGTGGDNDGERNDLLCSDGIDNDNDGRTDCADFGCRFDPTVTVCQGDPDFRFSVVARGEHGYDLEEEVMDTRISTMQLRAFGPMPFIDDSFFLLSARFEKTPRLTFAMFQVPLGKNGHYLNINSGGGGLSTELIRSAHKRLLLEPAFYLYNAFEQGNGAAAEVGGPLGGKGKFAYRVFTAGGTGRFSGNVGGGFVSDDNNNYTYTFGGQVYMNVIGYFSRWDTSMLYVKSPLTLATSLGVKYDQRAQERYPAVNANLTFKWQRLSMVAETYVKRELEFESTQVAYNVQLGYLAMKKKLVLAADFGEYLTGDYGNLPEEIPSEIARQRQETQYRAAAHYYLWRNIVTGTLLYTNRTVDPRPGEDEEEKEQSIKGVVSYRF